MGLLIRMNVAEILKTVKSEVSSFLDVKRAEKRNQSKKKINGADKFVKSNSLDLMDVKVRTRYVNGVCYGVEQV